MIDLEALRLLNEADIRSLVQPFGTMVKFRGKWRAWLDGDGTTNRLSSLSDNVRNNIISIININIISITRK